VTFSNTIFVGLKEVWSHKFRSLLTVLGIILGVSSLVAMSALVSGMEKGAREALVAIGGIEKVRVEPEDLPIEQRHLMDEAVGITINDVYALERCAPLVSRLSPEMRLSTTLSANGKTFRPWQLSGAWPVALEMNEHVKPEGRINVESTVRQAAAALKPLAAQDGITITVEAKAGVPPVIGDQDELVQLFQNLIHNAIKYGREGSEVRVRFGRTPSPTRREGAGQVFVAVEDEGEGIPREAIPRLTERFYRVDVKRSRERGGTGLGLAIVKHIVNRHQGRLQIESTPGVGSIFTVSLPATAAATVYPG